jgi:hypothetical protein
VVIVGNKVLKAVSLRNSHLSSRLHRWCCPWSPVGKSLIRLESSVPRQVGSSTRHNWKILSFGSIFVWDLISITTELTH